MKKIIKTITLVSLCFVLMVSFASCSKKETKKEKIDIEISKEATSLSSIEEEITEIAYEYSKDSILTNASMFFNGEKEINSQKGIIYYTFCKNLDEKYGVTTTVKYDMATKKAVEVKYEKGKGQFKGDALKPITEETKNILISSIFEVIKADSNLGNKLNGKSIQLTIDFDHNGIVPSLI